MPINSKYCLVSYFKFSGPRIKSWRQPHFCYIIYIFSCHLSCIICLDRPGKLHFHTSPSPRYFRGGGRRFSIKNPKNSLWDTGLIVPYNCVHIYIFICCIITFLCVVPVAIVPPEPIFDSRRQSFLPFWSNRGWGGNS